MTQGIIATVELLYAQCLPGCGSGKFRLVAFMSSEKTTTLTQVRLITTVLQITGAPPDVHLGMSAS